MAEAIGVVASGISIVQLAGQIATSIAKLRGYWEQVKQAPSDIEHLMGQVDSLSLLMTQIQDDQGALGWGLDHSYMRHCLNRCEESSKELQLLVGDLERLLEREGKWKRKVGALKVVFKKDDLKRLKTRLKSAVKLLQLAQGCYHSAMIQVLPEVIIARLSESCRPYLATTCHSPGDKQAQEAISSEESDQSSSRDLVAKQDTHWDFNGSWLEAIVGSLEYQRNFKKHRGKLREEIKVKYRLPSLLARRVWDVAAYHSRVGWRVNLQTYRTVSGNQEIFKVAHRGDLERMRELLSTHGGYVNDRSETNLTPLHYAALYGQYEMCELLISEGADVLAEACYPFHPTPLTCAVLSLKGFQPVAFEKTIRVLVTAGASDNLIQDYGILRYYNSCSEDAFVYLSQQCFPPYNEASAQECVNVAVDFAYHDLESPVNGDAFRVFQLALKPSTLQDMVRAKTDYPSGDQSTRIQMTLLHACATRLRIETANDFPLDREHWRVLKKENPWRVFAKVLIVAGAEISAVDNCGYSPFQCLLDYFAHRPFEPEGPEEVLKAWLSDLKEAGVDLQQYGQTEFALHQALVKDSVYCDYLAKDVTFTYGPEVKDWYFRVLWPVNKWAAQFWKMVEKETHESSHEETQDDTHGIPGSWQDSGGESNGEDEEYDSDD